MAQPESAGICDLKSGFESIARRSFPFLYLPTACEDLLLACSTASFSQQPTVVSGFTHPSCGNCQSQRIQFPDNSFWVGGGGVPNALQPGTVVIHTCTFNGQAVANGSSVTAYQMQYPMQNQGQSCISETRTCTNGALSGTYQYATCTLVTPELTPVAAAMLGAFALLLGWQVYRHNSRFTV